MKNIMQCRTEVIDFAIQMENVLRENDQKGGWDDCSLLWLVAKLVEEVGELSQLIVFLHSGKGILLDIDEESYRSILKEAADVGNLAMMITDRVRAERLDMAEFDRQQRAKAKNRNE